MGGMKMAPYQVWYITRAGKHKMRKEHPGLIDALRHAANLGGYDCDQEGGFFAYVIDAQTGLVADGDKWVTKEQALKDHPVLEGIII